MPSRGAVTPLTVLLDHLDDAHGRGEGFDLAWSPAVAAALHLVRGEDRRQWFRAFQRTREAWQWCYERR
jgi:hypothetical protein